MSVVTELILSADSEARYPAPKELRVFQDFLKSGDQRIRIAKILSQNEQQIVQMVVRDFGNAVPILLVIVEMSVKQLLVNVTKVGMFV